MHMNQMARGRIFLIGSLTILVCLSAFTVDVCIPAFPQMSKALDIPSGATHLVISAYLLSLALAQIPLGYLSERIGRVKTLYCGLFLFLLGGLVIMASQHFALILLGRFIQGAGGAVGPVMARAITRDISAGRELKRIMALLISALGVSTLIAPAIGSILTTHFSWKSCFSISLILGFLCLFLVIRYIPETKKSSPSREYRFAKHCKQFIEEPQARLGTAILGLLFFGYLAFVASFSTILSDQFGIPPSQVGSIFAFFVVFFLGGSWACWRLGHRMDDRAVLDRGVLFILASLPFFIAMAAEIDHAGFGATGLIFFFTGMGLIFSSAAALVMKKLPDMAGTASGIMGMIQMLCGTLGTITSFLLYQGNALSTLQILIGSSSLLVLLYAAGRKTITE